MVGHPLVSRLSYDRVEHSRFLALGLPENSHHSIYFYPQVANRFSQHHVGQDRISRRQHDMQRYLPRRIVPRGGQDTVLPVHADRNGKCGSIPAWESATSRRQDLRGEHRQLEWREVSEPKGEDPGAGCHMVTTPTITDSIQCGCDGERPYNQGRPRLANRHSFPHLPFFVLSLLLLLLGKGGC